MPAASLRSLMQIFATEVPSERTEIMLRPRPLQRKGWKP